MRVVGMDFVVQKKRIYWVRVVVPDELVKIFGKKNLMESLCTKDPTVAKHTRIPVIAKFQAEIAAARAKLEPQTDVPIAALVHEVVTRVITRGGFGRRFVAKKEADAILEQLKAAAVIPIIKEVSPE